MMVRVLYVCNTVLDNMNSKQARRCRSDSPMGMHFDHECDAVVCVMSPMLLSRITQIGSGMPGMVSFYLPTLPFFWISLSGYYTGELLLPALSGPEDTQLAFSMFCFFTAYMGSEFWL